ncbi:uncharacterized protein LOC105633937 isoform X4 [Jatropha curcas]|uniref:uncharacterized protein LOC105633937 isoform X4 n=1 Tax=Jatropha curcas TaxID=180498 RepID=UPI0018952EBF|nr:uncharacterized protein LOC105633937 isoform X4 [Jatropha curcas]
MAMVSWNLGAYKYKKTSVLNICCRKKERDRDHFHPYKVIEITPPPKNLGIRCFPPNGFFFCHPDHVICPNSLKLIELAMWRECYY